MTSQSAPLPKGKTPQTLKSIHRECFPPSNLPARSDVLHTSLIPSQADPRAYHLKQQRECQGLVPAPMISCSEFVPRSLISLLMRRKKNSALGAKFVSSKNTSRPDEVTDLEGAMHSFVTPVVSRCEMVGDYRFDGGHGVVELGNSNGMRIVRIVVLSASVHLDFEDSRIMLRCSKLDDVDIWGGELPEGWQPLGVNAKQDEQRRNAYDESLRRHMVFHLTRQGKLPPRAQVKNAMSVQATITFLTDTIMGHEGVDQKLVNRYTQLQNHQLVSLELLFNASVHQVRNEFSALEALCPQGYVYTYDPPSIFARRLGAPIINRLMLLALAHLSRHNSFHNLRVFAFNDYAEPNIIPLAAHTLTKQDHVRVMRKVDLFMGGGGLYNVDHVKEAEGAMLVVHNNSDGFGQNIETEWTTGSLDGAMGSNSSGAASLERERADLLDYVC